MGNEGHKQITTEVFKELFLDRYFETSLTDKEKL